MTNTKFITGFAIILSVLLVSGCIGGDDDRHEPGEGADSLDLLIDTEGRTTFDSQEEFTITLTAENLGPFDIEDVDTRLVGFGGISGTNLAGVRNWTDKMARPRPDIEMVGESATYDWDVTAPRVSSDSPDVTITLTGETRFRTKSLAVQKVVVADKEYLVQMEERGETVPVNPATEAQSGPISIDVEVPDPYVNVPKAASTADFRVKIKLLNDGSGNVYARTLGTKDRDYLERITLTTPAGITVNLGNCDFKVVPFGQYNNTTDIVPMTETMTAANVSTEKTLYINGSNPTKLRMIEGGLSRDISCTLTVDKDNYVSGYQTFELYAQADYTYLQDKVREITIEGTD